jgi:hypothetical protein
MIVVFYGMLHGKAEEKHKFSVFLLSNLRMDTETFII